MCCLVSEWLLVRVGWMDLGMGRENRRMAEWMLGKPESSFEFSRRS